MSRAPADSVNLLQPGDHQVPQWLTVTQPEACGPLLCALLNGEGGYLLCEFSGCTEVPGVENARWRADELEQVLKTGIRPPVLFSVETTELDGHEAILIDAPSGKDIPYAFEGDIFILHEGKATKADVETIRDMILRKQIEPQRWERLFSPEVEEQQLCNAACQRLFKSPRFPQLAELASQGILSQLRALSLVSHGRLTNAADVLLAREPVRRHPQARVRAVCYKSKTADEYQDLKHFSGPMSEVIEQLFGFVMRNTPARVRFRRGQVQREDISLYPELAIREGIVNAFAHRDYSSFTGGIKIEISPGKVEIWNSGELPEGIEAGSLDRAHVSVLRNPDIAHALYVLGYMEKLGRGSVLISQACKEAGLPAPVWHSDRSSGVTLTFFAPEVAPEVTPEVAPEVTPEVERLARALNDEARRLELQRCLGLKDAEHFRRQYLLPALEQGVIEMTLPHKPTSRLQKYRLTSLGKAIQSRLHS